LEDTADRLIEESRRKPNHARYLAEQVLKFPDASLRVELGQLLEERMKAVQKNLHVSAGSKEYGDWNWYALHDALVELSPLASPPIDTDPKVKKIADALVSQAGTPGGGGAHSKGDLLQRF
jgi:hypothetical protein